MLAAKNGELQEARQLDSTSQNKAFDTLRSHYDNVGEFIKNKAEEINSNISSLHTLSLATVKTAQETKDAASQVGESIRRLEANTGRFSI